jgi:hypothetical protein
MGQFMESVLLKLNAKKEKELKWLEFMSQFEGRVISEKMEESPRVKVWNEDELFGQKKKIADHSEV